jgi:hypothetical protein
MTRLFIHLLLEGLLLYHQHGFIQYVKPGDYSQTYVNGLELLGGLKNEKHENRALLYCIWPYDGRVILFGYKNGP